MDVTYHGRCTGGERDFLTTFGSKYGRFVTLVVSHSTRELYLCITVVLLAEEPTHCRDEATETMSKSRHCSVGQDGNYGSHDIITVIADLMTTDTMHRN